ncbi:MAG: general stress protein [Candidatus Levyibacteriota bacterium]
MEGFILQESYLFFIESFTSWNTIFHNMAKTILGIFEKRTDVEEAISELRELGYNPQDLSIVMKDRREAMEISKNTGVGEMVGGAATGVATGAVLGGLAGLLASLVLPGVGAFFIGGPIATALGLGGAAATTASGAATGAAAGGIIGALTSFFGMTHEEADRYNNSIQEGAILLAVPVEDDRVSEASDIFDEYNVSDAKVISQTDQERRILSKPRFADRANEEPEYEDREHRRHHTLT